MSQNSTQKQIFAFFEKMHVKVKITNVNKNKSNDLETRKCIMILQILFN